MGKNSTPWENLVLGTMFFLKYDLFFELSHVKRCPHAANKEGIQSASVLKSSYVRLLLPEARKGTEAPEKPSK